MKFWYVKIDIEVLRVISISIDHSIDYSKCEN